MFMSRTRQRLFERLLIALAIVALLTLVVALLALVAWTVRVVL